MLAGLLRAGVRAGIGLQARAAVRTLAQTGARCLPNTRLCVPAPSVWRACSVRTLASTRGPHRPSDGPLTRAWGAVREAMIQSPVLAGIAAIGTVALLGGASVLLLLGGAIVAAAAIGVGAVAAAAARLRRGSGDLRALQHMWHQQQQAARAGGPRPPVYAMFGDLLVAPQQLHRTAVQQVRRGRCMKQPDGKKEREREKKRRR